MRLRLDRLLANLGYGSRSGVHDLLRGGHVTLDGASVRDFGQKIALEPGLNERLRVRGEPLDPLPGITLVMHKPAGYTCSHREEGQLVYDLLPERWRARDPQLSTIGRLDKDTTGILLFTDDGDLLHRLTSPKHHVPKVYRAQLARELRGDEAELFSSGTFLLEGEQKPLLPAKLVVLSPREARVTIIEGRYHQVRRMFAAAGNHVEALHRESFGPLALPETLAPGSFRRLTDSEKTLLTTAANS